MTELDRLIADARSLCSRETGGDTSDRALVYFLAALVLEYRPAASGGFLRLPPPSAARPPKPAPKIASEL